MPMDPAKEQKIRERAYALWERDGRPDGRDLGHWLAAERELAPHRAALPAGTRKTARAPLAKSGRA